MGFDTEELEQGRVRRDAQGARTGPLSGIRVLEFAGMGPGPFAAMMLADMGADVVEIVRPGTPPPSQTDFYLRGRRRTALDLKLTADADTARELACYADVLIEGFRPGVMERLGLGPAELHRLAPGLVYARMTGWGQNGPLAQTAGHDINYISVAGALHCMRSSHGEPVAPLNLVGDQGGGALYLVTGILAALLDRERTGKGQVIDAAICDCVAHMLTPFYALRARGGWSETPGVNILDGGAHFYRSYRCADGGYISIGSIEPQFHAQMLAGLGLDAAALPSQLDEKGWALATAVIAERVATKTRDEWLAIFAGSDACVAPVISLDEAAAHPHLQAREVFRGSEAAVAPAPAPRFSAYLSADTHRGSTEAGIVDLLQSWKASDANRGDTTVR
jgi:alpha-methylacyl-CoA racemase